MRRGTDAQTADRPPQPAAGASGRRLLPLAVRRPVRKKAHSLPTAADSGSFTRCGLCLTIKDNAEEMLRASESLLALKLEEKSFRM